MAQKFERIDKLMRALLVREGELKVAEDVFRRAEARRASLDAAVKDLRATVRRLIEDETFVEDPSLELPTAEDPSASSPGTAGTIASRVVAFLEAEERTVEASEVAQALGVNLDTARTTLSKLFAKGSVSRPRVGMYCSLSSEHEARGVAHGTRKGGATR